MISLWHLPFKKFAIVENFAFSFFVLVIFYSSLISFSKKKKKKRKKERKKGRKNEKKTTAKLKGKNLLEKKKVMAS